MTLLLLLLHPPSLPSESLLAQCPATFKQFRLLKAYAAHFTLNHTNKCHFIEQIFAASSSKGGRSGKNIAPHTSQGTHILSHTPAHTHWQTRAHTYAKSHTSFCHQFSKQQTNRRVTHAHLLSQTGTHTPTHTHKQTSTHTHTGTLARYTHACRNTQSSFHYKTEVHRSSSSPKHKNTHTHTAWR